MKSYTDGLKVPYEKQKSNPQFIYKPTQVSRGPNMEKSKSIKRKSYIAYGIDRDMDKLEIDKYKNNSISRGLMRK